MLLVDLVLTEPQVPRRHVAGLGLLGAMIPIVTLALQGTTTDPCSPVPMSSIPFSLVFKALFILSGYVVLLMSTTYIEEGDFYEGEFSFLLVSAILGMVVIVSARDLITIFVALELLSHPRLSARRVAQERLKSNEAMIKYYLLGRSGRRRDALRHEPDLRVHRVDEPGGHPPGHQRIGRQQADRVAGHLLRPARFRLQGFGGAVPLLGARHLRGRADAGHRLLVRGSKAAGFVAMMELVFVGFFGRSDVWGPLFWILAALTMTVGNLIALRQTNMVRMLAYSSMAQAGYMLVPFAVAGDHLTAATATRR